jgi:EpsI family protein
MAACVPAFPRILNVRDQFVREEFAAFPASLGKWEQDAEASAKAQGVSWAGDDTLSRVYLSADRRERVGLRIAYRLVQRPPFHIREALVPPAGEGWVLTAQAALAPSEGSGRGFPVWRGVFAREGERVLAYVWLRGRGRAQAVSWRGRLALAWDTLFTRRADGALLRLDLPLLPGMAVAEGEQVLDGFCQNFKDVLPAYVPEP